MKRVDTLIKVTVRMFIRWFWLLALFVLVGGVGGKVLASVLPPTYQVQAVVQLNAQTRSSTAQIIQPVAAYATLVTSDSILSPVLQQYPQLDRQTFVLKDLVIATDTPGQTISIQVTLPDAKLAAKIANLLANGLVDQQNAHVKSEYDKQLQLANSRITTDQKNIDNLNKQYLAASQQNPPNTALLQQLSGQISQEQNLENQDISDQRTLVMEQSLYNNPLAVVTAATPTTKPASIVGSIPIFPLVLLLAVIIGCVVIAFLEQSSGRISSPYGLQQKISLPVLGSLRWTSPAPEQIPLQTIGDAKSPYAEDCRVMMADILFQAEQAHARIVAITGLKERVGSSGIAAQLAALLAQSKRSVLLIDANLHAPTLYKRVGLTNDAGLALMLEEARKVKVGTGGSANGPVDIADRLPVDSYILPTRIPNLFFLPAGKPMTNPSSLLSMPEMGQFLKWASKPIDFVVIDCPALVHAEAHVLGGLSDQTYLVVDATRDRSKQVVNAKTDLLNTGVKVVGMIVNKLGRWL